MLFIMGIFGEWLSREIMLIGVIGETLLRGYVIGGTGVEPWIFLDRRTPHISDLKDPRLRISRDLLKFTPKI